MMGTILRVNLNTGVIWTESADRYRDWIGGIGVASRILYDEVKPWVMPYDPANRLIICTGGLSGTVCPGSGRIAAVTKSPVTMGIASGNSGGAFAPNMRFAGFEYIVIEGRSLTPVYLFLKDGEAKLRPADDLRGLPVKDTVDKLEAELGTGISTMCIGPAAERMVRFGCVTVDRYRVIGKCGFGAVMGSKNLKAVVADGSRGSVTPFDAMGLKRKVDDLYERIDGNASYKGLMDYGTLCHIPGKYKVGGFNYRHNQDLNIPKEMANAYMPEYLADKYRIRQTSCAGCFVGCQNGHRIPDGPYAGVEMEGTPFNSVINFGTKLDIADYGFCIEATWLCNNLGMDMDSVGEILGWVMECYENGIMTEEDLDGLKPCFGDKEAAHELILKIANRDGVGDILSEGVARAMTHFSNKAAYYAIHQKGNDLYEIIRPLIGYGLGAVTSTRGGSHVLGSPVCESSVFNEEERKIAIRKFGVTTFNDALAYDGKPEIVTYYETIARACSSMGLCIFVSDWQQIHMLDHQDLADLLRYSTGIDISADDLKDRMMALLNLEKVFNYCHAGFTRSDDQPRERLFREAAKTGPVKGAILDHKKWDQMLDHYYGIHGWDIETGIPTAETLHKYGLDDLIFDLQKPAQAPGHSYYGYEPVPEDVAAAEKG